MALADLQFHIHVGSSGPGHRYLQQGSEEFHGYGVKMRLLSIIIPVFNVEKYIRQTLESVFNTSASPEDYEVIVINDGSQDSSTQVVQQFSFHSNLTILEQENQGLSVARMKGLTVADGEYVWFIDSDDWLVEDGVGKVLQLLKDGQKADVLMFPLMWTFTDSSKNHLDYTIQGEQVTSGKKVLHDLQLPVWASQRFVLKRSLMGSRWLFFPDGLIHQDEYFGPVLLYLADTVRVFDKMVYFYRIRPGSTTTSRPIRSPYDKVSNHRHLVEFIDNAVSMDDRLWFRKYCLKSLTNAYTEFTDLYGTPEFKHFAISEGHYVWEQWKAANPDSTLKKKLGRLLMFVAPEIHERFVHLFS